MLLGKTNRLLIYAIVKMNIKNTEGTNTMYDSIHMKHKKKTCVWKNQIQSKMMESRLLLAGNRGFY